MKKFINHLRNKPEATRRHILHGATIIFAVLLITVWIFSLGRNLKSPDTKTKFSNDLEPFSVLKDDLVGGYQNLSASTVESQQ